MGSSLLKLKLWTKKLLQQFRILPWTPPTIRQKLSPIPLSNLNLRNLSPRLNLLNLSNLKPMTICSPHCQLRPQAKAEARVPPEVLGPKTHAYVLHRDTGLPHPC